MVVPLHLRPRSGPYSGLNYRSARRYLARTFEAAALPFAEEDALDLVLGLTGLTHADYLARGTEFISADAFEAVRQASERRLAGEPVDRILGWRDFYGRRFAIAGVLSPRGDTETLLLAALDAISGVDAPRLLELGTGSGALAVSLACERDDASVLATDISDAALAMCEANGTAHGVADRVSRLRSDWFERVPAERFDAVISNPPYIDASAMAALPREVAEHDPALALAGGADGLDAYRIIVPGAREHLRPGGWLGVEIGFDQGGAVAALLEDAGYRDVRLRPDPAGLDRVVSGRMPE